MKTCPYCKEEIQQDAIKCRHCQSMLLPLQVEADSRNEREVTYVVDRGLIRFGKFVGASLALFLIVGAYFFGFKLEATVDKVQQVQKEVSKAHQQLAKAQTDLVAAQTTVARLKGEVEAVLSEAKAHIGEISRQREAALKLVISMRELTPRERDRLEDATAASANIVRGDSPLGYLWKPGATIRIGFIGGTEALREKVKAVAVEWLQHANLKFEFVQNSDAHVRVAFDSSAGSWSFLAVQSLAHPKHEPTMNLGWLTSSATPSIEDRKVILHEFGHVLGLVEEHLNPAANLPWDKEEIYASLSGPPNFWSKEQIDHYLFRKLKENDYPAHREFDPESVMNMDLPESYFLRDFEIRRSSSLSQSDKELVARLYPK